MLPEYTFKFIVIGDSDVGKSCLSLQFTHQIFEQEHIHTIGAEFATKLLTVNSVPIKLHIWDTAGQERFRSITRAYHREAAGAILVYDITRRETFNHIVNWLEDARDHANPNLVVTLVGNKSDLSDRREVSREEGENFARENRMVFIEASAKAFENINELFTSTAKRVVHNIDEGVYNLSNESCGITGKSGIKHAQASWRSGYGDITKGQQGGCCS